MPWLVDDTERVVARIGQAEIEVAGMTLQPSECGRVFESFVERSTAGRADIDGAAAVMLAKAGCRIHPQNGVERIAAFELAGDQAALICHRAQA